MGCVGTIMNEKSGTYGKEEVCDFSLEDLRVNGFIRFHLDLVKLDAVLG